MAFGSVLAERIDSSEARKSRGAFFTPPAMTDYLCSCLLRSKDDRVLEPACGEGEFLVSAAARLTTLGASREDVSQQLLACDLHPKTVEAARARLSELGLRPNIVVGDFFGMDATEDADVALGNPPYIRYQEFSGEQRELAKQRALEQGVRISSLSSSWAPFVVHACSFLRRGGRLGMVLPAELLSANYAGAIRAYFLAHFTQLRVVMFERSVFPEVEEEVILLLAEGYGLGVCKGVYMLQVESMDIMGSGVETFCTVTGEQRWPLGAQGARAHELLRDAKHLVSLADWGTVRLGAVTGANDYFCLSADEADRLGLGEDDVVALCPAGSRHLRGLSYGTEDFERLSTHRARTLLFYPGDEPSEAALRYIRYGLELGVDQRYKCRARKPWWRVPGIATCDLFVTYMNGVGPNLCSNEEAYVFLNSVHGLRLREPLGSLGRRQLPLAYLSTPSQLSAEVYGRAYGGGILKLEPREAMRTLVLGPEEVEACATDFDSMRATVQAALLKGRRQQATETIDATILRHGLVEADALVEMQACLAGLRFRRMQRTTNKRTGKAAHDQRT